MEKTLCFVVVYGVFGCSVIHHEEHTCVCGINGTMRRISCYCVCMVYLKIGAIPFIHVRLSFRVGVISFSAALRFQVKCVDAGSGALASHCNRSQ